MSKDKKGKNKKQGTYDVTDVAAIRWLAMAIEQAALSAYITKTKNFSNIEKVMRAQVVSLNGIGQGKKLEEGDCPNGWIECDGMCSPMCLAGEESASPRER